MPPNEHSVITESSTISSEEKDHLERSTKKIKNVHTVEIYPEQERPMETEVTIAEAVQSPVVMETDSSAISQNHPPSSLSEGPHTTSNLAVEIKPRSFKDAVLQSKESSKEDLEKRLAEFPDSDEEDMESDEMPKTKSKIRVEFSREQLKRSRQQYKGCLIIKLLGRNMGFKLLMDKITRLWSLEGMFTPVDLGMGFYLIKFETKNDYNKVYTGGPWIVQDHYLTVRKWHPEFKADMAVAINTVVWLRIPLLPLEFHDEEMINSIATKLGKLLKIDNNTLKATRASYARICVEIDLSKPLAPSIAIGKYDYLIEYEHVHWICFNCGRVGHRKDGCSLIPAMAVQNGADNPTVNAAVLPDTKAVRFNGLVEEEGPVEIGFGEWMVVSRRNKKQPKPSGPASTEAHDHSNRIRTFADRINKCKLIDMGSSGPKFTWTNSRQGLANIQKRLDRGLCNTKWRALFPERMIKILPRTYSDHSPFIMHVYGNHKPTLYRRPFRFEAAWLLDPSFNNLVTENWKGSTINECINNFTKASTNWNKEVFGNIFRKKRWVLSRIEGIQKSQDKQFSHNLQFLEKDLIKEYSNILAQEELHWYQKSGVKWITQGERNTRFFHLSTIIRRRRSKITMLKGTDNVWVEDPDNLKALVQDYFTSLFQDSTVVDPQDMHIIPHCQLSTEDNVSLCHHISNAEIWDTIRHIPAFKAPGPDGIQAIFYHKCWNIVGEDVCNFIKHCFVTNTVPPEVNKTLIALIPKCDKPDNIKLFRPISLCNVLYKTITKIMVSRLRPFLSKIISPYQSSFIPGRSTNDNIIITQELLHTLRSKKGKKWGMIFKIDLEKAYDKISWTFLEDTLHYFNFDISWITLIMNCVCNASTAILWNGEPLPSFNPGRGLRQGDPLSPYLFVLCMERLSNMINAKVDQGLWKGISVAKDSTSLTHLFFADDLILFGEATEMNCRNILEVLDNFCDISGQSMNLHKSKMYVSPNLPISEARNLSHICGIALTDDLGNYLGIPLLHSRVNKNHFNRIIEKIQSRLAGWKTSTLAFTGRATLIQSVTSASPSYTMQTLELPISVCNKIDKLNRDFLWGDTALKRKIHLVNWHRVCKSKDKGGLGLKKAKVQNLALLSKLGWHMHNGKSNLWTSVLHSKYLKKHNFSECPPKSASSHIWKGILHTRPLLEKGIKWIIGDGEYVSSWKDWWCGSEPLATIYPGHHTNSGDKVKLLIDSNGDWNLTSISHIVSNQTIDAIYSIKLPRYSSTKDCPQWVGSSNGKFSVASAYDFLNKEEDDLHGWSWIWKLKLPQKIKGFIWLLLHDRLPTNQLRAHRGMIPDNICPRCGAPNEDRTHLLRECDKAKEIWLLSPVSHWRVNSLECQTQDWLCSNLKKKGKYLGNTISQSSIFAITLWQIWKDRNKKSFDNVDVDPHQSLRNIASFSLEISEAFKSILSNGHRNSVLISWSPPCTAGVKLNTDGCWMENRKLAGYGGIFRDHQGHWLLGYFGKQDCSTILEVEIWGIYRGLTIMLEKGYNNISIESDSLDAVKLINEGPNDEHPQVTLIQDAKILLSRTGSSLTHVFREANQCADHLAHIGAEQVDPLVVLEDSPQSIRMLVLEDALGAGQFRD